MTVDEDVGAQEDFLQEKLDCGGDDELVYGNVWSKSRPLDDLKSKSGFAIIDPEASET